VFDGEYEGIDKNNPLSLDCQLIPEWDRKFVHQYDKYCSIFEFLELKVDSI
jgi:hypothetical protein